MADDANVFSVKTLERLDRIEFVGRPTGSGLPDEQRAALARVLRAIQQRDFPSVAAMAKAWDVEQSYLNQVVNGTAGAGLSFLLQLREKSGLCLDTLLGLDLRPIHLVEDEKVRVLVASGVPSVGTESATARGLAEAFERLEPAKVQPAPEAPKVRPRQRPKPTA